MLAGVVVVVVVGLLSPKPGQAVSGTQSPGPSGSRGIVGVKATKPLWKPEPALLLSHAKELRLTPAQEQRIQREADKWQAEKDEFQKQMKPFATHAPRGDRDAIAHRLGAYSDLSRKYDQARTVFWDSAIDALSAEQKKLAEVVCR